VPNFNIKNKNKKFKDMGNFSFAAVLEVALGVLIGMYVYKMISEKTAE
jgi:hypothetical protein